MLTPTRAALVIAATHRLTRLVTQDYLTEDIRHWLQARLPEKGAYLIGCPWCSSMWLGGAVATANVLAPRSRLVQTVTLALAASTVAGLVATHLDPPEDTGSVPDA